MLTPTSVPATHGAPDISASRRTTMALTKSQPLPSNELGMVGACQVVHMSGLSQADGSDSDRRGWIGHLKRLPSPAIAFGVQILVICSLVVVSSLNVYAQSASTGALVGTVTDPTGAVLQNAQIVLRKTGTGESRTTVTGQDGSYRLLLLSPGEHELKVEAIGFAPVVVRVLIRITEAMSLTARLTVEGVREDIVVQAPLTQTGNVALGGVIASDTIEALPLVNRNLTQILGLTAGTNTDIVDATQLGAGSQEIRANGARSGDNNFMLNGVDANSYGANMTQATPNSGGGLAIPAPDALQEFKVQNSLYDAQYGRGGGANVVIETKSGTEHFHG